MSTAKLKALVEDFAHRFSHVRQVSFELNPDNLWN